MQTELNKKCASSFNSIKREFTYIDSVIRNADQIFINLNGLAT